MKQFSILVFFITITVSLFAQKKDLIVTIEGDSLICRIDSINKQFIYFETVHNYKLVHTLMKKENIKVYKEKYIKENDYFLKPGTSFIKKKYNSMFDINKNLFFFSTKLFSYGVNYERVIPLHDRFGFSIRGGVELYIMNDINKNAIAEFNIIGFGPKNNLELGAGYSFPLNSFHLKAAYKYHAPKGIIIKISPFLGFYKNTYTWQPEIFIWGEISIGKSF